MPAKPFPRGKQISKQIWIDLSSVLLKQDEIIEMMEQFPEQALTADWLYEVLWKKAYANSVNIKEDKSGLKKVVGGFSKGFQGLDYLRNPDNQKRWIADLKLETEINKLKQKKARRLAEKEAQEKSAQAAAAMTALDEIFNSPEVPEKPSSTLSADIPKDQRSDVHHPAVMGDKKPPTETFLDPEKEHPAAFADKAQDQAQDQEKEKDKDSRSETSAGIPKKAEVPAQTAGEGASPNAKDPKVEPPSNPITSETQPELSLVPGIKFPRIYQWNYNPPGSNMPGIASMGSLSTYIAFKAADKEAGKLYGNTYRLRSNQEKKLEIAMRVRDQTIINPKITLAGQLLNIRKAIRDNKKATGVFSTKGELHRILTEMEKSVVAELDKHPRDKAIAELQDYIEIIKEEQAERIIDKYRTDLHIKESLATDILRELVDFKPKATDDRFQHKPKHTEEGYQALLKTVPFQDKLIKTINENAKITKPTAFRSRLKGILERIIGMNSANKQTP